MHPTKARLIETTSQMLDGADPQHIRIDDVLATSGVAKGSLYHHFEDFPELLEVTLVFRFGRSVDSTTAIMNDYALASTTKDEFWERMHEVTLLTQNPQLAHRRAERARTIGMAGSSDRLRASLAVEQERLTASIVDLIRAAQSKSWVNPSVDPLALAIFIQAYTLGRAVDDVALTHIDSEVWNGFIRMVTQPLH